MDVEERLALVLRDVEEVITVDELRRVLETGGVGYLGFEPSGVFHIGWLVWALKFKDLVDAGIRMKLLAATWHAWVNDKLGGDMRKIHAAAKHVALVLDSLGLEGRYELVYAEDLVRDSDYWATLLKVAKSVTLARVRRALTIMGRRADEAESDFSKLIYPLMQVTDIIYMNLDIALGGMDQRRAHVLQREVAGRLGFKKAVAIHTPLIPSLKGPGRMDFGGMTKEEVLAEVKMSKSKPETAVFVVDTDEEIMAKIRKAYCPARVVENNPVLAIAKHIVFRGTEKEFVVRRPQKYGGDVTYTRYEELEKDFIEGKLHPLDLKRALAEYLVEVIRPIRERILSDPEAMAVVKEIMGSETR